MQQFNTPITQRGHNRYLLELRKIARLNRKKPTASECLVWNMILRKRYLGFKFLRQKPINQFILDFYCPKLLLAVEIDGGYHDNNQNRDVSRDKILSTIGIKTIRYTNNEVNQSLHSVINDLKLQIENRIQEL